MAEVVSEIANGGIRYRPQFVKEVDDLDGKPVIRYKPDVESRAGIDPAMLDIVRDAMCDVVNAPGGTGHAAQLPNVTVCGKTGTAQVVKEQQGQRVAENALPMRFRDNGWFVAFAPRDHPRIAIAAVVEHAGHGGSSAGPVVHDVMQKFFELYPGQAAAPGPAPERAADQGQRAATLAVLPASSPNGRN
jgi:penicillin-binding protein 2